MSPRSILRVVSIVLLTSTQVKSQSVSRGINDSLINIMKPNDFDLAGSWTAYIYDVQYDSATNSVMKFECIDTIKSIVFNRLMGFESRAYIIESLYSQNYWQRAILNLPENNSKFDLYWSGKSGFNEAVSVTTYDHVSIQFNIDVPDTNTDIDLNQFVEIIRDR